MRIRSKSFMRSILFLFLVSLSACSTPAYYEVRDSFYAGNYHAASESLRDYYEDADEKDRLLYLMEAGVSLHTEGRYKDSIRVFQAADLLAENIKTSISGQAGSFIINENTENFKGESFERVMIKFYIALNYMLLDDLESARVYFRKLDYDQREMKFDEAYYRQNLMARYLDAVVSENLERYNDARVQYNNILMMDRGNKSVLDDFYILALKEGDRKDEYKYRGYRNQVLAFDQKMNPTGYSSDMGELLVIHQAGRAAIKESRGTISPRDPLYFALRSAIYADLATGGSGVTGSMVMVGLSQAENPIPIYRQKDKTGEGIGRLEINRVKTGSLDLYQDYSQTAISNFNENYPSMVRRNAGSLASKMIAATISARVAATATKTGMRAVTRNMGLMGMVADVAIDAGSGYAAGSGAAALVEPDLRSWSLLPSNFQVQRIFLKPGKYDIQVFNGPRDNISSEVISVKVESGKLSTIAIRTFSKKNK